MSPSGPGGETGAYTPPKSTGKTVAILIALLLVTNVVTGLAVYYVAAPAAPASTAIKVIGPWSGPEQAAFLPVLDLFTRTTGIAYEYIQTRQEVLTTQLPTQFAAGQTPGDVIFMPSAFIKNAGIQGHALDLNGTIGDADYAPGALDPLKNGSAIFGGAYTGKVKPGFWYRQSFFQDNGLTVPTTWLEFEALLADIATVPGVADPIISGDGVGWPLSDATEHFIATYGGPSMHRQLMARTLSWTDTSVRDVFANYLVPTLQDGRWSAPVQWDTGVQSWWNGTYGLYFMGSWITGMVSDPSDLGVFALPEAPGTEGIVFAADYFFVPRYSTRQADARELVEFLAGAAAQTMQVRQGGHLATAVGVPLTAYPVVDAQVADLLTGKDILSDLDDTVGGTFQTTFWSQLQLLWSDPAQLDNVLAAIEAA